MAEVEHVDKEKNVQMSKRDQEAIDEYTKDLDKNGKDLEKGPMSDRNCTDWPMCIIFLVFIVGMFAATAYGFKNGDPKHLVIGWDQDGSGCGFTKDTLEYPYLYWAKAPELSIVTQIKDLAKTNPKEMPAKLDEIKTEVLAQLNTGVCVKACPATKADKVECKPTKDMLKMTKAKDPNAYFENCVYYQNACSALSIMPEAMKGVVTAATCKKSPTQAFRYDTKMYGVEGSAGFCLPNPDPNSEFISPKVKEQLKKTIMNSLGGNEAANYMKDILITWKLVASSVGVAFVISVIYLILLQCIGGAMIWLSFIAALIGTGGGGVYCYMYAGKMREANPEDAYADYVTYAAYAAWVTCGLVLCIFLCCFSALQLGIAIFKATVDFTKANLTIFLQPVITLVFFLIWVAVWIGSVIFVFSTGEPKAREGYTFMTEIKWSEETRYIIFYQVFGLFWMNAFIIGCCQFVIACAACIWFFQVKSDALIKTPVLTSIKWVLTKHLGSIAFGALLIAICQMIRFLFEYYRKNIEKWAGENKVVKVILCITGYCLWCLEKCVKFLTKNAYIQVALSNSWFCSSAFKAFSLILMNARRFGAVGTIGSIYMIFGVLFIGGFSGFYGFLVVTQSPEAFPVTTPIPTTVACGAIGSMVAYMFMSIFSFSSDAILQSFLLAESLKLPSIQMPDALESFGATLNKHNGGCC